ncbi:MAG: hypothetical protein Q8O84_02320 [Nanoarchaeota archaeon]|nr:hypothetical protein [Nanoarchaeota archaeon]
MFVYRKISENIEPKFKRYEAIITSCEESYKKGFENKKGLEKISQEISEELSKKQTTGNQEWLFYFQKRITKLS